MGCVVLLPADFVERKPEIVLNLSPGGWLICLLDFFQCRAKCRYGLVEMMQIAVPASQRIKRQAQLSLSVRPAVGPAFARRYGKGHTIGGNRLFDFCRIICTFSPCQ